MPIIKVHHPTDLKRLVEWANSDKGFGQLMEAVEKAEEANKDFEELTKSRINPFEKIGNEIRSP